MTNSTERPETRIMKRVIARRESLGLTQRHVSERIARSDLYGAYTHGSYRNLETTDYEDGSRPRNALNRQLVLALSEALECLVSDLATDEELSAIRPVPYRRAQWPEFMLQEARSKGANERVPQPALTANRIRAYMTQRGPYTISFFAELLTGHGYKISSSQLNRAIGNKRNASALYRHMNYALCAAAASVFRGPMKTEEFDIEWLLSCRENYCPHCDSRLMSY